MTPQLAREIARWYKLRPHPVQDALVQAVANGKRFAVVPAGRRSGKSERAKRFTAKSAMGDPGGLYFAAAPTREQAKRLFWDDLKLLTFSSTHPRKPSETDLKIFLPNGAEIHVVGMDRPERFEGTPWRGGVVDEIANVKPEAIDENIMPALDTVDPRDPGYQAWCWFTGVPDGLGKYYDMAEYARTSGDPLWGLYHWKSADILSPEKIQAAMRRMGAREFRQEYEGSFETASGRVYDDYGPENTTREEIASHEQIHWMHDFNYSPLSSAIGVRRGESLYLLDEVVLQSAVARQSAMEFCERYRGHGNKRILLFGDPAGKAGEKHAQESSYLEIEKVLRSEGWTVTRMVKSAAPSIVSRQNAVRAKICNAAGERSLFVNPNKAPYCHKGLSITQLKEGSTFIEAEGEYQHITTAVGYCVDVLWPTSGGATTMKIRGL